MSLTLYYAPRTRATRPRWLLEELGVPFELVTLDLAKKEHKTPEYLAIHPHGSVPALRDGDLCLIESGAICLYLADRFPHRGLAPVVENIERGTYLQYMMYVYGTLEPALVPYFQHTRSLPEPKRDPEQVATAKATIEVAKAWLTAQLGDGPWLMGMDFSAADVVVGSTLIWARAMGLLEGSTELLAYCDRLRARPAYQRAMA